MEKKSRENSSKLSLRLLKQFILAACVATLVACGGGGGSITSDTRPTELFVLAVEVNGLVSETGALVLQNKGADDLPIYAPGLHHFHDPVEYRRDYNVVVKSHPKGFLCSVLNGVGDEIVTVIPTIQVTCSPEADARTIGGTVSNLNPNSQLVLRKGDGETYPISANGPYRFGKKVANDGGYIVTVLTQPAEQTCTVENPTRTNVTTNINDVNVKCSSTKDAITIGGTVTGLAGTLVLLNNGTDPLTVNSNAPFTFKNPVAFGGSYEVTVGTPPEGQTCSVANDSRQNVKANVNDIEVTCSAASYTVSVNLSGLSDGNRMILKNNGEELPLDANQTFVFTNKVAYDGSYAVTFKEFPVAQNCKITNGSGSNVGADVIVQVACSPAKVDVVQSFFNTNAAGYFPVALIRTADGSFYGAMTASKIRNKDNNNMTGYIFKVTPDNVMTNLHWLAGSADFRTTSYFDPVYPTGIIQAINGSIYGTSFLGGLTFVGAMYEYDLNAQLNPFTQNKYSFPNPANSGEGPVAELIQDAAGNFYGITYGDVLAANTTHGGAVFKVTPQGEFSVLHEFKFADSATDGVRPNGKLLLLGDDLYGTTEMGGANNRGTVFTLKTSGLNFSSVESFEAGGSFPPHWTEDRDARNPGVYSDPYSLPYSGLIKASDGYLYLVAKYGGDYDGGRIIKVDLTESKGNRLSTHYSFAKENGHPIFELMQLKDGKLYGLTQGDGSQNDGRDGGIVHDSPYKGIIFRIALAKGSALETLHVFSGIKADGNRPSTRLVLDSDEVLHGGTRFGGAYDSGALYKFGGQLP